MERLSKNAMITVVAIIFGLSPVRAEDPKGPSGIRFFSQGCQKSFVNLKTRYQQKRVPMVLTAEGEQRPVDCCSGLASLRDTLIVDALDQSDTRGHLIKTHYQECFELAILRAAREARVSNFDHLRLGQELYDHLDSRTLPILPSHPELRDEKTGALLFRHFIPFDSVVLRPTQIVLAYEDGEQLSRVNGFPRDRWETTITVLAAADFDEDETEDLLVSVHEDAGAGSYRGHMTLILTRIAKGGLIQAKSHRFLVQRLREWHQADSSSGNEKPNSK